MALIDNGQEKEGQKMLDEVNARAVHSAALRDMLAVVKGDKELYDKDGQRTESFKDA